jgi:hypothetical protein
MNTITLIAVLTAILTAGVGTTGVVLTCLTNRARERLEERRICHEENRWMLELINKLECELLRSALLGTPKFLPFSAALTCDIIPIALFASEHQLLIAS